MEHPDVARTMATGYSKPMVEHHGVDALGNEILYGDRIVEFESGDVVLYEAIDEYLKAIGCKFYEAK